MEHIITVIGVMFIATITGLEVDHWGTKFVFSFLKCGWSGTTSSNMIVVTAREATDVYVLFAETGQSWTFSLTEADFYELDLSSKATAEPFGEILTNKSILIQASKPVSVYGYSNRTEYSDGFLVLPVVGLGTHYIAVNIDDDTKGDSDTGPQIVIAAPWDNTEFKIVLSNANVCFDKGHLVSYNAGDGIVNTMKALDVFNLYCKRSTTGAIIKSSYPIAVLSGSARVSIPYYADEDHVVEMLPSYASLGSEFVINAPAQNAGDSMVRIVAARLTKVDIITSNSSSLELASQTYHDLVLDPGQNLCMSSNQPILVVMFLRGINSTDKYVGDAFMMVIPPVNRYTNDYVIFAAALWNFDTYINVIGLTANVPSITGLYDSVQFTTMSECPGYSSAVMAFKWIRRFTNAEFMIMMFGVKLTEGYGFPGGMKLARYSDLDYCEKNQCLNGGWCLDDLKTYTCHCTRGYSGPNCEDNTEQSITADQETTESDTSTISTTETTTTSQGSVDSNGNNQFSNNDATSSSDGNTIANTTTTALQEATTATTATESRDPGNKLTNNDASTATASLVDITEEVTTVTAPTTATSPSSQLDITEDVSTATSTTESRDPVNSNGNNELSNNDDTTRSNGNTLTTITTSLLDTTQNDISTVYDTQSNTGIDAAVTTDDSLDSTTNAERIKVGTYDKLTQTTTESYDTTKRSDVTSESTTTTTTEEEVTTISDMNATTAKQNIDNNENLDTTQTTAFSTDTSIRKHVGVLSIRSTTAATSTVTATGKSSETTLGNLASTSRYDSNCTNGDCICACPCAKHLNDSEILSLLENQKKFLKVEKKTLSQTIRKKQSSENIIQSETNLGITSVLLVTFLVSGIVAIDLTRFITWWREKWSLKSRLSDTRRMIASNTSL